MDDISKLPVALRCTEITEAELEVLVRLANDLNATTGVLSWTPRRVPTRGKIVPAQASASQRRQ